VFSASVLSQAFSHARLPAEREHVTPYIYNHPESFKIQNICFERDESRRRWTVDTPEDYELIKILITELYSENSAFNMVDCLALLDKNPEWELINRHIEQKKS
jgi:spore coat polysaccharide biosynthesis protein SpsF